MKVHFSSLELYLHWVPTYKYVWFLLFLDKSPKKVNIKDTFCIHVKTKKTGNKLVSLPQACWRVISMFTTVLKWSLSSYIEQGKDKIVNTTVWRLKPFIDGNIVVLYMSLSSIKTRMTISDFNAPKICIMWNSMDWYSKIWTCQCYKIITKKNFWDYTNWNYLITFPCITHVLNTQHVT